MSTRLPRHRGLRLVAGPPGPAPGRLEHAFVEEVRRLKAADPLRPITVIAGNNHMRLRLRRVLAVRLGGHANIRFLLLRDLARELGAPVLHDRGRRRLPSHGRELVLRETLAAHAHGTYFDRIALTQGFLDSLGATLSDLKEAGVEPALLRAAAAALRSQAARRPSAAISGRKMEDIAELYETYDDSLRERRLHDEEDLLKAAVSGASAAAPGSGRPQAVLVYGFYDASWLQRRLIQEHLAFKQGTVFFPFDPADPGEWDFARPMLEWLGGWIPELVHLPPAGPGPGPREVAILSAPGEAREVVEATRWLISLARDRSLPFGSMALLYRGGDSYRRLVWEVMQGAGGVPHYLAGGRPQSWGAAARALLLLVEMRRDGLARRTVIDFLSLTEAEGPSALWDRLSREAGVVKGAGDWSRRLEALASARRRRSVRTAHAGAAAFPPAESRAARELASRVEELSSALEALPQQGRWADLAESACALLRRFVPRALGPEPVERALSALGALDEITSPVSLEEFLERARAAIEAQSDPEGEFEKSGIFVGGVMDARLLSFDAAAVVGLVERGFPAPPRQDPILLDAEREELNRLMGEPRLPIASHRLDEERLLFRLATSSATESLMVSYPRLEPATARPRNPSPFLLRLASSLEGRPVDFDALEGLGRTRRVGLAAVGPAVPGAAIAGREFDLCVLRRAMEEDDETSSRRVASFLAFNPILRGALAAEEARWGESRFTAHDGVILRPSVLDDLRSLHPVRGVPISASRIERYASCPLKYFLGDVLRLEPLDPPEEAESIDPLRRGSLVHAVLFELFSTLRSHKALPLRPEGLETALEALRRLALRAFQREEAAGVAGHRLVWEVEKEKILDDLEAVVRAEAGDGSFVPAHFEIRFGMPPFQGEPDDPASSEEPVPFELRPGGPPVLLKGKIDRIDLSADGRTVRVTDYKTGRMAGYKDDALLGGTTLQLPFYMLAAEALLGRSRPGVRAAEARYLSVDQRGRFRSVRFGAEALASRREDLARAAATFANGVDRGAFFAAPSSAACEWCDHTLACGEGREARFERKKTDATASDFLKLRDLP
ncbi:MAG TPA: PD-(D/E)XK nuclease family protein [Candidatus Polarisedimenticolia bacterium]|nr:PD-(D/E)XK nuclease family protein [Candidatus Polarisedimenticolia bacterium]